MPFQFHQPVTNQNMSLLQRPFWFQISSSTGTVSCCYQINIYQHQNQLIVWPTTNDQIGKTKVVLIISFCCGSVVFHLTVVAMTTQSHVGHGHGDGKKVFNHPWQEKLQRFYDPSFIERYSPRNCFVWAHMSEYEKRWVQNVEWNFEKDMLRACNRYLRILYYLRSQEDWIEINQIEGEFQEQCKEHISKYKAAMTDIRFSFIQRSIAYTESCFFWLGMAVKSEQVCFITFCWCFFETDFQTMIWFELILRFTMSFS